MSIDDVVPDRDALHEVAKRRVRQGRWIGAVIAAAAFLLPVVVILLVTPAAKRSDNLALILLGPALVGVGILLVTFLVTQRRDDEPQLIAGADAPTRRAVQQALRTGGTTDPRTDALARDSATHTLRNSYLPWIFGINLLLQLIVLVSRILDGDDFGDILLSAALVTTFTLLQAMLLLSRRRSRRYLAAPTPQP